MTTPTADNWFVQFPDKVSGPFTLAQLQTLVARGRLVPSLLISRDKKTWLHAAEVGEIDFSVQVVDETPSEHANATKHRNDFAEPTEQSLDWKMYEPAGSSVDYLGLIELSSPGCTHRFLAVEEVTALITLTTDTVRNIFCQSQSSFQLLIRIDLLAKNRNEPGHLIKIATQGNALSSDLAKLQLRLQRLSLAAPDTHSIALQLCYRIHAVSWWRRMRPRFVRAAIIFTLALVASVLMSLALFLSEDDVPDKAAKCLAIVLILPLVGGFAGWLTTE